MKLSANCNGEWAVACRRSLRSWQLLLLQVDGKEEVAAAWKKEEVAAACLEELKSSARKQTVGQRELLALDEVAAAWMGRRRWQLLLQVSRKEEVAAAWMEEGGGSCLARRSWTGHFRAHNSPDRIPTRQRVPFSANLCSELVRVMNTKVVYY